jgi:Na+/proline symporter
LRGLLLAGVLAAAMSSLDSTMAALGSSAMLDLARPLLGEGRDERGWLRLSRLLTILFALILAGLALIMRNSGTTFLWLAYQITSLTYAGLLGLFLLGLFTRRGNDRWNPLAALAGSATVGVCLLGARQGWLELAWTWHLPLGTMVTFGVGCLLPRRT